MSKSLSSVAVTAFDNMVKQSFQTGHLLQDCAYTKNNVTGDIVKFRKMGKGLANQKSTSDMVTPMNVNHSLVSATLENWNAPEFTDIFDQAEVNFDEKMELASCIANALGRRKDQLLIDAMDASTPDASDITVATNLTQAEFTNAKTTLLDQGVNSGKLVALINANGLESLLNQEKATSADYANVKALVNGEIDTYCGFKVITMDTRTEGGLSIAANIVDSWFFHKDALGLGIGMDVKTEISYQELYTSWLCNGMMKAGAAVRDTGGLVKVQYDQTA